MNNSSTTPMRHLIGISVFVVIVMLLISKDSYLHDMPNHNDSAWFFMCGKAWANGLTPYVDFADSKGPLLWLIYAIGYILTPHSYIGVFWLSCIAWTTTLYYSWRTATLFLKNGGTAFVAMLFVALAGLQPLVHNETRCEDFALPFVAYIIYAICRMHKHGRCSWSTGISIGISLAATGLMKYNITLMLIPLVMLSWIIARRQSSTTSSTTSPTTSPATLPTLIAQNVCGGLLLALPFLIYFLHEGNLSAFLNEYVLVTMHTTSDAGITTNMLQSLLSATGLYALLLCCVSALAMARLLPDHKQAVLLSNAAFFALCSLNSRPYYFSIYSPFVVFVGIIIVQHVKALQSHHAPLLSALIAGTLLATSNIVIHDLRHADYGDFFTQNNAARHDYYSIENIVAKVPKARIVSIVFVNVGVCSDALPACKYWARQTGATEEMNRQQIEACTSGKADFAMVPMECHEIVEQLRSAGWHTYDFSHGPYGILLMSKRWLGNKPTKCYVSNTDVLLKHDVIRTNLTKN